MLDSWQENCRLLVRAVLADRGWKLVDWNGLADIVYGELSRSRASNEVIERATIRHYCRVLFTACTERGTWRQEEALRELWVYLRAIALYKVHDVELAEELTQEAQVKVWGNLERCRDPDRFLGFCQMILLNLIRDHYRQAYQRGKKSNGSDYTKTEITQTEWLESNVKEEECDCQEIFEPSGDREADLLFEEKTKEAWLEILERCIANAQYRMIIVELFFDDKAYDKISSDLGIPVGTVYVYRQRALQALRDCNAFKIFYKERLS